MNLLQQVFEMISQLQESSPKSSIRIATSAIDSIFFELEAELEGMTRAKLLTTDHLHSQKQLCLELIRLADSGLEALKTVEFMNDHQFYCFLRLKKIFSNLESFRTRYDKLLKKSASIPLSNPIVNENQ